MNQFDMFSKGLELANLVVTSDLLHKAWAAISETPLNNNNNNQNLPVSFSIKSSQHPLNCKIIVFGSRPTCNYEYLQGEGKDLVLSTNLGEEFEFLGTKVNPTFSIHKAAADIFSSLYDELFLLKDQIDFANPLIITGNSLGGSIASLFTLWLLDNIYSKTPKRPICITFGSPLIGDAYFQYAILERPTWTPCFLHVVSNQDPVPKLFISPHNTQASSCAYKPFGTFLFCSEWGCSCFDQPDSILELMVATSTVSVGNEGINVFPRNFYGGFLENLKNKAICRGVSELGECNMNPLRVGITLQVESVGVSQQQQTNDDITKIEKRLEIFLKRKRNVYDPTKKLNESKTSMTYLEWYKKVTTEQGGYYDIYKNARSRSRDEKMSKENIVKHQRILTQYWSNVVKDANKMPQKEGVSFRTRWLYAGTNYRRMVEPLLIAMYYQKGKKDYLNLGRDEHFKLLEQWVNDEKPVGQQNNVNERKKACSLTEDSCFWAHVEEAIISCSVLTNRQSSSLDKELNRENLTKFEDYVMSLIRTYSVSSEIFLEQSSFMQWWKVYETIMGASYKSLLADFMRNRYREYA